MADGNDSLKSKADIPDVSSQHSTPGASDHDQQQGDGEPKFFGGFRLAMIILTINLSTFIAALDLGIVATAIPAITDDFHALNHIAWYSGACFILVGATSAMWGKLYTYFMAPRVYMSALALYLVGSIVAAAAPSSIAFIIGRAIQGWGCAGTLGGSIIIISQTTAPDTRPKIIGIWMAIFMVSTVLGPLLGGVFTTEVSWRWCFWVNLPIGGFALVLQVLFLRVPKHIRPTQASWKVILLHLDFSGCLILATSLICFTLAMQWGGLSKPWSDGSVIATLVMWLVLTIAFFLVQWLLKEYAMTPLYLLKPRIVWSNCLYAWISNAANFQIMFYLPIYFQSIKGDSAIMSGVYTIPFAVFYAVGCLTSGFITAKTRLLQPIQLASPLFALIGAGLFYPMDDSTAKAWYIGAQIPFGFGVGLGTQVAPTALQGLARPQDVAVITGTIFTWQTVSGAYWNTAAQSLFENKIYETLAKTASNIDTAEVSAAGASGIRKVFSGADQIAVLDAYQVAIKDVFTFAIACAAMSVFVSLLIPPTKLPGSADGDAGDKKDDKEDQMEDKMEDKMEKM